jgi:hypothetical protein
VSYILASSVHYQSADDALNDLFGARERLSNAPKRKVLAKVDVDEAALVHSYVRCDG